MTENVFNTARLQGVEELLRLCWTSLFDCCCHQQCHVWCNFNVHLLVTPAFTTTLAVLKPAVPTQWNQNRLGGCDLDMLTAMHNLKRFSSAHFCNLHACTDMHAFDMPDHALLFLCMHIDTCTYLPVETHACRHKCTCCTQQCENLSEMRG